MELHSLYDNWTKFPFQLSVPWVTDEIRNLPPLIAIGLRRVQCKAGTIQSVEAIVAFAWVILRFFRTYSMSRSINFWTRKFHRWGALLCCIPLFLVIVTGILLQVKKQVPWVQPATENAGHSQMTATWDQIIESAMSDPNADVKDWDDIDRLDVRPGKGIVKVRCKNRWELQLDLKTAKILSSNYRRSDFIESLHDGSFFGDISKLSIFLINGIVLLGLWLTGLWLWWLPIKVKRAKQKKQRLKSKQVTKSDGVA